MGYSPTSFWGISACLHPPPPWGNRNVLTSAKLKGLVKNYSTPIRPSS